MANFCVCVGGGGMLFFSLRGMDHPRFIILHPSQGKPACS